MQHYRDVVQDRSGNVIGGAIVTVIDHSSGQSAPLYSDANGSVPLTSVITDTNGTFSFYVASGRYDITISKNGIVLSSVSDVFITVTADYPTAMSEADATAGISTLPQTISASVLQTQKPTAMDSATAQAGTSTTAQTVSASVLDGAVEYGAFTPSGTGAVSRTVQSKLRDVVSVFDFMTPDQIADVQAGTLLVDVTSAIQNAINYAAYNLHTPKSIFLPNGLYKTTDTIHIGYGIYWPPIYYPSVIVYGETSYGAQGATPISGIVPAFNDRPAINIQGCRDVRVKDISVIGVNHAYINSVSFDRTNISNWYGPNISAANNTRYAPYAGITIDAYSGSIPPTPYPNVTFPSFFGGAVPQYGKVYNSQTVLESVFISGFVVGVMVQPGIVPNGSQGDFLTIKDSNIESNIINYASGNNDNRNPNFYNNRMWGCYTVFDTVTYGNQQGSFLAHVSGCCFDQVYRVFNINTGGGAQGGYPVHLDSCYSEGAYSFGNVYSTLYPYSVSITNSTFGFNTRSTEASPIKIYSGPTSILHLNNVRIGGDFGFYYFDSDIDFQDVFIEQIQTSPIMNNPNSLQGHRAIAYTCGIFANKSYRCRIYNSFFTEWGYFYNKMIDSESLNIDIEIAEPDWSRYGFTVPWFVNNLSFGGSKYPVTNISPLTLNRVTYNLSSISTTNNNITFTCNTSFITDNQGSNADPTYSVGKGDIVIDSISSHCYMVDSATFIGSGISATMTITIKQLTNVTYNSGTGVFTSQGTLSTNAGTLTFYNARRFYPSCYRVSLTTTSGSGNITHKVCGDETAIANMTLPIKVNDYLISSNKSQSVVDSTFPKFTKVTAIDPNAGTAILNQTARRSYFGETMLFVRGT